MTPAQKAKQALRDLQETLELIDELEDEIERFEHLMEVKPSEGLLIDLEESRKLLALNIEDWNKTLANAKL